MSKLAQIIEKSGLEQAAVFVNEVYKSTENNNYGAFWIEGANEIRKAIRDNQKLVKQVKNVRHQAGHLIPADVESALEFMKLVEQKKSVVKIGYAPKTVKLADGTMLHFWYANNPGRESNNCTIIRSSAPRAMYSAQQENIISQAKTLSYKGKVNFSKHVQQELGLN